MLPFPPDESCFLYHFPHLLVFSKIVLFEDFQFKHMQRRFYFAGNAAPVDRCTAWGSSLECWSRRKCRKKLSPPNGMGLGVLYAYSGLIVFSGRMRESGDGVGKKVRNCTTWNTSWMGDSPRRRGDKKVRATAQSGATIGMRDVRGGRARKIILPPLNGALGITGFPPLIFPPVQKSGQSLRSSAGRCGRAWYRRKAGARCVPAAQAGGPVAPR